MSWQLQARPFSRQPYPSDVSDDEWAFVAPYLTLCRDDAPQRRHDLREVFNAARWMVKTGAPWRYMPSHFPPWPAVYQQTQRWIAAGVFDAMVQDLRALVRLAHGRPPAPTAVVLDGRTLRSTPESGARASYDGHKRQKGSKVHVAVDTLGNLLALTVTPAGEQERAQVAVLAGEVQAITSGEVELAYVDQGYTGETAAAAAAEHGIALEVVKLPEAKRGFVLLPRRWVVEVVFPQLTKADVLTLGAGGQRVADLHVGVGDDHAVDEQQDELAALLEGGAGEPALHALAEGLERGRHAGELLLALGVAA